jgi:hypothetical protein
MDPLPLGQSQVSVPGAVGAAAGHPRGMAQARLAESVTVAFPCAQPQATDAVLTTSWPQRQQSRRLKWKMS